MNKILMPALFATLILNGCASLNTNGALDNEVIVPDTQGRTMGQVIDDKNLRSRLNNNLNLLDPRYFEANTNIYVHSDVVLLVGQVPTQELIQRATQLLKDDPQVKEIHNHLTAGPNSSTKVKASDKWLAVKTRSRMFSTDYFPSENIEIIVEQGVVYLMGRVKPEIADQAVKIASEVTGVQRVVKIFQLIP